MTRRALILALLSVVLLTACKGDSTGPGGSIAGNYTLRTVNGQNLPYVEVEQSTKFELLSETLVLTDAGTFTVQGVVRVTFAGQSQNETFNESGTYTHSGSTITFAVPGEQSITGTASNSTITFTSEGLTYVFQK